ncbi:hypothetical protein D9M72_363540 [compost metagenome]
MSPLRRLRTRPSASVSMRLRGSFAKVLCSAISTSLPHRKKSESLSIEPAHVGVAVSAETPYSSLRCQDARRRLAAVTIWPVFDSPAIAASLSSWFGAIAVLLGSVIREYC